MKADGLLRHLLTAFVIALVVYFVAYTGIEHRRTYKGPWRVTFTNAESGVPVIVINQLTLGITNVQITFPGASPPTNSPETIAFDQPHPVPYPVPFGKCLFMDTTFLPGTVVFELYGHEIQLIPRVLTIDKEEQPWHSGASIPLTAVATNAATSPDPARGP